MQVVESAMSRARVQRRNSSPDAALLTTATRVAVVIVNWNGWRECIECLNSLFAQHHQNIHAFVVDNDSHDGSVEHILSWCRSPGWDTAWRRHPGVEYVTDRASGGSIECRVVERSDDGLQPAPAGCSLTIVRSGANLGFAGGCNVGVRAAGLVNFEYFWFLNADTVVDHNALVELLDRAARGADIGMVGSTIRYYDTPEVVQAMGGARLDRSNGLSRHIGQGAQLRELPEDTSGIEQEIDYVMGASMLVSSRYIREVGLMEEDYFLYFEEIDWALRGHDSFRLGFAPRSHVFHKWGVNSHKAMPLLSTRFYYRNQLKFVARFLPDRLSAVKRALFKQIMRHAVRGRWTHSRVIISTLFNARHILAGVKPRV